MVRLYPRSDVEPGLPETSLPRVLMRADRLLRRYEFLKPFRAGLNGRMGRPTIPMERYLRLMFLKVHYGWGYERLVAEVAEDARLRRFCRIPDGDRVPHSTTLLKLTHRFGPAKLAELLQSARTALGLGAGGAECSV